MIKYFKELENSNKQYLNLIDTRILYKKDIKLNFLPLDFFIKHKFLFNRIKEYDLLYENNDQLKLYTNPENIEKDFDFDFDWMYRHYEYSGILEIQESGLSKHGIEKIYELEYELIKNNAKMSIEYFHLVIEELFNKNRVFKTTFYSVYDFLNNSYQIAKKQNKLNNNDELLFKSAFKDLQKYIFKIPTKEFEPIKMYLPNSWYITPYNHLYNTMGPNGHKEANLIYPFYYEIVRDDEVCSPLPYLKSIKRILKNGYINAITFKSYTNLIYNFISIYPETYYNLDNLEKIRYRQFDKKTYNPKIVNLIIGIESAHAGLYNFFYNVKNNSKNYLEDLEYIKQFNLDEILIRCCGFHKISSICDRTITTSCINYEIEFKEYIEKGWKIDFIKPIIFNQYTKRVEEYPDDFLVIRKILKNNKL